MRELKKHELAARNRSPKWGIYSYVSTTVAVFKDGQPGYCYVSFSDAFIEDVGRAMPRGVSMMERAYLRVDWTSGGPDKPPTFRVNAVYSLTGEARLLWETSETPSWLNFHKAKAKHHGRKEEESPVQNVRVEGKDS